MFAFRTALPKTIPAILSLISAGLLSAQIREPIGDFKLVTPNAGWAVVGNNLLWTESAGSAWSNITPSASNGGSIHGVFFSDTTSGWAMLTAFGATDTSAGQLQLLRTDDTGRSWSATSFKLDADDLAAFAGNAHIFFVDRMHGWIMLKMASSSNFSLGLLFMTSDGGTTWNKLPPPPVGELAYFATAADGWLAGGPNGDALFVTRNGGYTWSKQLLPVPAFLVQPSSAAYAPPRFVTANDGLMRATFISQEQELTVLYESHDRGATWELAQAHQAFTPVKDRSPLISSLVDKGLIMLSGSKPTALTVVGVSEIRTRATGVIETLPGGNVTNISFTDERTGWLLVSSGHCTGFKTGCSQENRLVVTQDGAQSFLDVTPDLALLGAVPTSQALLSASPKEGSVEANSISQRAISPASVITVQNKEGFDKCEIPTVDQMQKWWNGSPYRAVAFYIGGVHRSCSNTALDANWVNSVAAMGWGLIPIWVGPQANTSRFASSLIHTDSTAEQQGKDEASHASDQAAILGLSSTTIIYYDMESPASSTPHSAVQAFLNGWVEGMHARQNTAGVYSSHPEFQFWTPTYIANVPDAIWFAWFFQDGVSCGAPCQTVLGVPDISPSLWANNQRIRQTSSTIDMCWASVCFTGKGGIDEDWVDGPVAKVGGTGGDTIPPTISSFTVSPNSMGLGGAFSIQAMVSDSGGSGLSRIELWRAPDSGGAPGAWSQLTFKTLTGNGPTTAIFSDAPLTAGVYWYGIHAFDVAGNQANEPAGPINRTVTVTPSLSVTGGPLTFAYQSGSILPGAKSLSVSVSSGSSSFMATSNAAWLQVSPGSGTLGTSPTTLSVSVAPASFVAGVYNGTITVTANGASSSPQTVNVTLTVTSVTNPPPSGTTQPIFTAGPISTTSCPVPTGSTQFSNTVQQIYAWVQFSNAQVGDQIEWDAFDSNLVKQTFTTTIGFTGGGCAWWPIPIVGNANASKTGTWKVNYLYNGTLQSSNSFQLTGPTTTTPSLSVTGGPLTFAYQSGSSIPPAKSLSVSVSSGSSSFTATSNATWLQVSPGNGSLGTSPTTLSVSVAPASFVAGVYNGTITVTANGASSSPQTVNVTLTVTSVTNPPPSGTTQPIFTAGPISTTSCPVPTGSTQFSNTVQQIYAWVQFSNAQVGDQIEWDAFDSNLVKQTFTTTIGFTGGGCAWWPIPIVGNANASKTGTWKVNYLYNGTLQSSNSFQLTGPTTTTPSLSVTGGPLTFAYQSGSSIPPAKSLSASVSSGSSSFTATSNATWLQVSPGNGSLGTSPTTLSVSVAPASFVAGVYNGTITVTANGASSSPQTVNVTLTVTSVTNPPPSGTTQPIFTAGPISTTSCPVPTGSTQFSNTVQQIYAWVQFPSAKVGDVVEWDWLDPNLVKQASTTTIGFTGSGCAWSWINIAANANASKTGTWKVNYLYNGTLQSSNSFQLTQ